MSIVSQDPPSARITRRTLALRISGLQPALRLSSTRLQAVIVVDDLHQRALAGEAAAQADYGQRLLRGDGVTRNKREGRAWCRRAADQGNANGQFLLGGCYYNGEGGFADLLLAYMWFCLAAEQGLKEAVVIRRLLAAELTDVQLREAKRQVRAWRKKAASDKGDGNRARQH